MLEAWCELNYNKVIVNGCQQCIWLNSEIRIENKPIFIESAFHAGLVWVHQLYEEGQLISIHIAFTRYKLRAMEFYGLVTAIPKDWKVKSEGPMEFLYDKIIVTSHISSYTNKCPNRSEALI